jgi:hypothetical protein
MSLNDPYLLTEIASARHGELMCDACVARRARQAGRYRRNLLRLILHRFARLVSRRRISDTAICAGCGASRNAQCA